MKEKRIIDYIRGSSLTDSEITEILNWIEASEENQKKYNELKKLWVVTGLNQVDQEPERSFFRVNRKQVNFNQVLFTQWARYAAIIVLAFLAGVSAVYFTRQNNQFELAGIYNVIHVPNGEKTEITLYDGTSVWLNSGTTFRYPAVFSAEERNVYLDGEAFFDVAKDKTKPYFVNAGEMKVKVLGTRFNVYAYQDESLMHTTLEEGMVDISVKGSDKTMTLNPGEQVSYFPATRQYEKKKVDTDLFTSWKANILRFENAELADILKKMERWYDVKMMIDEDFDTSIRYTITIKTESLREMLGALSVTTNFKYEIENELVRITKK